MHKSTGNDVSAEGGLDHWGHETLLVFYLTGHYRKPLEYSDVSSRPPRREPKASATSSAIRTEPASADAWERFAAALDDDFNTPAALAVMHEWRDHELLARALGVFGLGSLAEQEEAPAEIVELAARRQAARDSRDFDEADRLREELEAAGWEARDEPGGYRLVPVR